MKAIYDFLKQHDFRPYRYTNIKDNTIIDDKMGRFIVKKNKLDNEIMSYLKSRSFDYIPNIVNKLDDEYIIEEFIDEVNYPKEQKIIDLVNIVSLLHNKTTHYKEVDLEDYKRLYEDIKNNIEYLKSYYFDILTTIETHVYMSPSEYLLARNISKINLSLIFANKEIDNWYKLVSNKTKERHVVLHNNLDIDHFIKNDKSYLIGWSRSKIGNPIFDLYVLYKRHALDFDFDYILKTYEQNYPLKEDEKKLLFVLITLPDKIEFNDNEYNLTKKISNMVDTIYKTDALISPYYSKNDI